LEDHPVIVKEFAQNFQRLLKDCALIKDEFYNSFDYTESPQNYTHPRTMGLLVKAGYSLPETEVVDIDCHLKTQKGKQFRPDLVIYDKYENPLLIIDFESPNSSDSRIPEKNVEPYILWNKINSIKVPYIIITSLPKQPKEWKLPWTARGYYNEKYKRDKKKIVHAPHEYWYGFYNKKLRKYQPDLRDLPLYFANLDGKRFHFERSIY
jgi:hypothetical protein